MAKLRQFFVLTAMIVITAFAFVNAQTDSTDTIGDTGIKLSAKVEQSDVPMNRTVDVVFTLEWYGDLDRYEIFPFDNPILNNFEIVANSSANKVTTKQGKSFATHEYTFTLKPQSLGMGYVESVIIRYTDLKLDTDLTLTTNRIEIKVTDPVAEPGDKTWLIWLALGIVLVIAAVYLVINLSKRKAEKQALKEEEAERNRPVEKKLLEELKAAVNLNDPALDVMNGINLTVKILKRFLNEKFEIMVGSKPTEDIIKELKNSNIDQSFCNDIEQILVTADVLKFSGNQASKQELERLYGLLDTNLYKSLRGEIETIHDENNENE